jgi:tetratricopeptide (TPR) repeat protein
MPLSARITVSQKQCNPNNALPVSIHGQLRFAVGGQPANRVIVRLEAFYGGTLSEVVTDNTGKYQFAGLAPGYYIVTVRLAGFIDQRREVDLCGANSAYELFQLVPEKRRVNAETSGTPSLSSSNIVNANVPEPARRELENARAVLASGKRDSIEEGIKILESLVNRYPTFLAAHLMLGTAYMDLRQWEKAEALLKKVIEIDPKMANAYFALGEIYLQQKKYGLAEKTLQDGLVLETRSSGAHLALARVYWGKTSVLIEDATRRASLEHAYLEANQALKLDPDLADAHLLKGNLLFRARRAKDALTEFDDYLRLDPKGQFADQTRVLAERIRKALAQEKP